MDGRAGMLLNILQGAGELSNCSLPATKKHLAQNMNSAKGEEPWSKPAGSISVVNTSL